MKNGEVMYQYEENNAPIEWKRKGDSDWEWQRTDNPLWLFASNDYRVAPQREEYLNVYKLNDYEVEALLLKETKHDAAVPFVRTRATRSAMPDGYYKEAHEAKAAYFKQRDSVIETLEAARKEILTVARSHTISVQASAKLGIPYLKIEHNHTRFYLRLHRHT